MTSEQESTRVVPYISLAGRAGEAIEFWGRAFVAEKIMAFEEDGRLRHAEVRINGGPVYLTDFHPDPAHVFQPTRSIAMHLAVPDGGAWMERGQAAGCRIMTPWQQLPFGGFGRLVDPFGVVWSIASPKS
ncbi:VOC family protein [Sphingomonas antarctica]|uniref:VOC family protein n=1 Tax=Sphingomonas antarctica TaxID=2040274 RepID=UPI0039EAC6B9